MLKTDNKKVKKILWMTWKDMDHPEAGGAELYNEEVASRLSKEGIQIHFVVGGFKGQRMSEVHRNGFHITRVGNRYTVYWKAYRLYKKQLQGWADVVIDEMNTIPFFTKLYSREPTLMVVYQLCREIWLHQMPLLLSLLGYVVEPMYLRLLNDQSVITISKSTSADLQHHGFQKERISIVPVAITLPLRPIKELKKKAVKPTLISFGSVRSMKQTLDIVSAFELAKKQISDLRLDIAGGANNAYGKRVQVAVNMSPYKNDITLHGYATEEKKIRLLQQAHLLCVTSVKEGWCLTVTEAGSQGTPAVAYNTDGLRDSVQDGKSGMLCKENSPKGLAREIVHVLQNKELYQQLQQQAYNVAESLTFEKAAKEFQNALEEFANKSSSKKNKHQ